MKSKIFLWFAISSVAFLPYIASCQAPNLGTTSNFAVFTAVGAFDNLGFTIINGDIGTNVGAYTGFPPGVLIGTAHIANPTSAQAAIDVNSAYNDLVAAPCDTVIGVLLGGGQILPPRVYCIGAATSLDGDLILDGQGDPNSIFIIQIDGALSTSTFSRVLLIDSAAWCNVYWQVNGAFSLGNSALFCGTIINNGAISMLESSDMLGRALSISGAIDLHNNDVTNDCFSQSPLPVELVTFAANCENRNAIINWTTSSESNNDFYSLERSSNAINWQIAGTTNGAGNSNVLNNYSFTDTNPFTNDSYYRLKQTDFDATFKYSDIISYSTCIESTEELYMYPNPTQGPLNFYMEGIGNEQMSVSICNAKGTVIYNSSNLPTLIDLSDQQAGVYFISIQSATKIINRRFIIIK